ncbi:haloacid dehalogenase type II [Glycomyces albus]
MRTDREPASDPIEIEAIVFDVLGTMVDEPSGLRAAIGGAVPGADEASVEDLLAVWRRQVEREQARMARGERAYADTAVLDREAAEAVAERAGIASSEAVAILAEAGRRLPAWDDSAAGLEQLSRRFPVLGLSNACRAALLRLNAHAGLRWHQVLSAEEARAYKPAPEVYRLAVEAVRCPPERLLMVAAHAWDLRGAQEAGMRTAYVERPVGDPPSADDAFDLHCGGLDELAALLERADATVTDRG